MGIRRFQVWSLLLLSPILLTACGGLEKEIVVPQPPYDRQLVVECYLEAGKPFRLALSESVEYLASPELPAITDATVQLSYDDQREKIPFKPVVDTANRKVYNYALDSPLPGNLDQAYTLEITDPKGRRVTGTTRFPSPVRIKELSWEFGDRDRAYLIVRFDDPPDTEDYYRFVVTRDSLGGSVEENFTFDDRFATNNEITLGTNYDYKDGDPIIVTLFHIDKAYFDFIQSTNDAANANGNPFGQPSQIKSTVSGGIGVFTALAYDRRTVVVKK